MARVPTAASSSRARRERSRRSPFASHTEPMSSRSVATWDHEARLLIEHVAIWAARRADVAGLALVGSQARGTARKESDIDLVLVVDDPAPYLDDSFWIAEAIGRPAVLVRSTSWGRLVERRVRLSSGLEVELGIVDRSWAATDPVEPGTARVIGDGARVLVDPRGSLVSLTAAVAAVSPSGTQVVTTSEPFPRVERLDARVVRDEIARRGGPRLELARQLSGGAVGAWLVHWPDGHPGVLTWAPPLAPGSSSEGLSAVAEMVELARAAGIPAPRLEAIVDLGELGAAVLQERAPGQPVKVVTARLVERLCELAARRRGLLAGSRFSSRPWSLHLRRSGSGYCLHEPLRAYSRRSAAALLERIETLGEDGDEVVGEDLVHFDYHLGNVLVDEHDPQVVTALVDWGGARAGPVSLDLAILAFTCSLRTTVGGQSR